MKLKKKLIIILLSIACLTMFFAACGEQNDHLVDVDTEKTESVTLNYNYYELEKFDFILLTATADKAVTWSSEDDTVATVDQSGRVEGVKAGKTVVNATDGEFTATCKITVTDSGLYPSVQVDLDEETNLIKGTSHEISRELIYNGKSVQGVDFSFESTDQSVVSVSENGVLTALSYGTATVKVFAAWKGFDESYTTATIKITVIPDVNLKITNSSELALYTVDNLNGTSFKTSETVKLELTESGKVKTIDESKVVWSTDDDKVASVNRGVVTATGYGKTKVIAKYTFTSDGQEIAIKTVAEVSVERPVVSVDKKIVVDTWIDENNERGKNKITVSAEEVFGDAGESVVAVTDVDADKNYILENGVFDSNESFILGERRLIVYNAKYGYEINAQVVTMAMSEKRDLKIMLDCLNNGKKQNGYYVLTDNINYCNETFYSKENCILKGTLDGNGFAIYNVNVLYGFITSSTASATIKNIALINVTDTGNMGGMLLRENEGVIENVYLEGTLSAQTMTGAFAYRAGTGSKIINSVAVIKHAKTAPEFNLTNSGAFVGVFYKGARIENSFVVSEAYGTLQTSGSKTANGTVKNSAASTELTDAQKQYNRYVNATDFILSQKTGILEGTVALSANVPVEFSITDLPTGVTFKNGVLATSATGEQTVTVKATYVYDRSITKTENIKLVKVDVKSGANSYVNATEVISEVTVGLDKDELNAANVKGIIYESDLSATNTEFTVDEDTNSLIIDKRYLGYGSNKIYLYCEGDVYYFVEVMIASFNEYAVKTVTITEESPVCEMVFDKSTLKVDTVTGYKLETSPLTAYSDFTVDVTDNSVCIPYEKLKSGSNTVYLLSQNAVYKVTVYNYAGSIAVSSASELYAAMQSAAGNVYVLTEDVDMTGYKFGSDAETRFIFKGVIDGAGHKVTGVSFENNIIQGENYSSGSYVWQKFDGQLINIAFDITVAIKADEDPANNYGYPDTGLINATAAGTLLENVYTQVKYDGKNAKYRNDTTPINEPWFFVAGYPAESLRLTNVVHNVTFENCGNMGKAALVRSLVGNIEIKNSFVITNEKTCGLIGVYPSKTEEGFSAIIVNGEDNALAYKKGSIDANAYVYGSVRELAAATGDYADYFTHEMWKELFGKKVGEYDPATGDYLYDDIFKK